MKRIFAREKQHNITPFPARVEIDPEPSGSLEVRLFILPGDYD